MTRKDSLPAEYIRRITDSVPAKYVRRGANAVPTERLRTGTDAVPTEYVRRSYFAKFTSIMLIVLLITAAAAVFFYVDITGQITANVQDEMEMHADAEADDLAALIESNEQTVSLLAANDELADGTDLQVERTLEDGQMEIENAHAVHHVDLRTDRIIHSTDESAVGDDITDYDLDIHTRYSANNVREIEYTGDLPPGSTYSDTFEHDGEAMIAFLSQVDDSESAVMAVVPIDEIADRFAESVDEGYTHVVDTNDGDVMITDDESEALTTYRDGADSDIVRIANLQTTSAVDATEYDDTDEVVGYAYVPGTDWVLATHAPQDTAYALADDVATSLAVLIGITLAGFVVIGVTIGRSTAIAMEDLADDAVALSAGETDVEIADDGRIDEVGQVRDSFEGIREYVETAADQADAIARQEFDAPILEEEVPGKLGDSLETMRVDLEQSIDDLEESREEAVSAQQEAADARREAEALADRLERKATEFADVMSRAAEGDFTQRLDEGVDNEALAEIAVAFNAMLEDLERTIVDIQDLAGDVDEISADVTERVQEIERASDDVSRSTEEIATATADQSDRFQEVYGEMNDLSATIEEIASTADDVASVSGEAADRAVVAGEAAGEIRTQMDALERQADAITEQVEELDAEMSEISEVVDLIDDIADQTNLLALNASIEAAAANEEGDGFAVVANEVKSLAEETSEATQEVDDLISEVQASVDETVAEIDRMRDRVDESSIAIDDGIEAIDAIADQVETANDSIQSINEATDEQARASERVVTMVDDATTISEETKDETETVAAAVEEQTATISEVASGANSLTEMADGLRSSLDAFEVDASGSTGSGESDIVLRHDETDIDTVDE